MGRNELDRFAGPRLGSTSRGAGILSCKCWDPRGQLQRRDKDQVCFLQTSRLRTGLLYYVIFIHYNTWVPTVCQAQAQAHPEERAGSGASTRGRASSGHVRQVELSFSTGSQGAPLWGSDIQKLKGILPEPMSSGHLAPARSHLIKLKPQAWVPWKPVRVKGEQPSSVG